MAGHSKWANIKHKKSRMDAQKGKIFTKLAREISVAAKEGGGDVNSNTRLRMAVQKAKEANMPNDNIQKNIQKGLGKLEGESYESVTCEGYGPGGAAILVESLTDNRNRAIQDIRSLFTKYGGNLGEAGCVKWMFERKGYITINKETCMWDEEELMLEAIEAGAEDLRPEGDYYEIITNPEDLEEVKESLKNKEIILETAELTMLPHTNMTINDNEVAIQLLKLMEALEDLDDVQNVHANFVIPDNLQIKLD